MSDREERIKAVREYGRAHEVKDEILSRITEDRTLTTSESRELGDAHADEERAKEHWLDVVIGRK